ncbi:MULTISPECIES: peptidoglycan-binding domain-containing protein [Clostridium]|uniref:peptidoglycan-binding domain-containing protein n=1 Tax=Clostridium TaxID=1485 RepID=UPI0008269A28|nr:MULTISPECIES: peptidoglycan-binding domain-containing protein [Clostridium]PJI09990.1 peptodoglycan-binding protein [Clostridium sp. CT7]
MKNLKLKTLSLGIVSSILISSSAFAATNNTKQINTTSTKVTTQAPSKNATLLKLRDSWDSRDASKILGSGGYIELGDEGTAVLQVQYRLQSAGFLPLIYTSVDGIFGQETYNAVRNFQSHYGLRIDGIVGWATWNELLKH